MQTQSSPRRNRGTENGIIRLWLVFSQPSLLKGACWFFFKWTDSRIFELDQKKNESLVGAIGFVVNHFHFLPEADQLFTLSAEFCAESGDVGIFPGISLNSQHHRGVFYIDLFFSPLRAVPLT